MFTGRKCGARRRTRDARFGQPCQSIAMKNGRCRIHGGKSTGAKTPEGKAIQNKARMEGFQRWLARQWVLKRAGLLVRFPAGRQKGWNKKKPAAPEVGPPAIEQAEPPAAAQSHAELMRDGLIALEVLRECLLVR